MTQASGVKCAVREVGREAADVLWVRCLEGVDRIACFGSESAPDRTHGDVFWEILEDGEVVGLGWARNRCGGKAISQGRCLLPAFRRRGRSREHTVALTAAMFAWLPTAKTIVGMAYSTNPPSVARLERDYRRIGTIPLGDQTLYIYLIAERDVDQTAVSQCAL